MVYSKNAQTDWIRLIKKEKNVTDNGKKTRTKQHIAFKTDVIKTSYNVHYVSIDAAVRECLFDHVLHQEIGVNIKNNNVQKFYENNKEKYEKKVEN